MQRSEFQHDGLTFSYLDNGADAPPVLFLHGHFMGASDFGNVYAALGHDWRCIGLDQRGHGHSDHTERHSLEAYLSDVNALLDHLGVTTPVVLVGHSAGAEVAYLFAAAYAHKVGGLVIEDMNVNRDDHDDFVLEWAGHYPTRRALEEKLGERLTPYLGKSIHHRKDGWTLRFDPVEILRSEAVLNGDHWHEWLSSTCPTLIIRGAHSPVVPGEELAEMARRRPNTHLVTIDAGHSVHIDRPDDYIAALRAFLADLTPGK